MVANSARGWSFASAATRRPRSSNSSTLVFQPMLSIVARTNRLSVCVMIWIDVRVNLT